ncbi:MAG: hypothetical protein GVY12_02200 [Bacteroidetes bacterium]|jgi:hypothetical protein|nr:hypothetical protein [Bacteroidota bacterium]
MYIPRIPYRFLPAGFDVVVGRDKTVVALMGPVAHVIAHFDETLQLARETLGTDDVAIEHVTVDDGSSEQHVIFSTRPFCEAAGGAHVVRDAERRPAPRHRQPAAAPDPTRLPKRNRF